MRDGSLWVFVGLALAVAVAVWFVRRRGRRTAERRYRGQGGYREK